MLIQLLVDEVPALRTQSLDSQEAGVVVFMIVRLFTGEYRVGGDFYDSQDFRRFRGEPNGSYIEIFWMQFLVQTQEVQMAPMYLYHKYM